MKKCTKCGVEKPLFDFQKPRSRICKQCIYRRKRLKEKYNLSQQDFEHIKHMQGHACAICKQDLLPEQKTHIDHDHKTGKVRGILCNFCNVGLGHFKDSIFNLNSAIKYLSHYEN